MQPDDTSLRAPSLLTPGHFWNSIPKPIVGLSPMDGVTDASFRWIAARYGRPDLSMTEFTSVEGICAGAPGFIRDFVYSDAERPIIAQIYGRSPEQFYQVAHIVCELGFDGLDINMGCPAKNVASKGCGAGLILNPPLALELMHKAQRGIEDWVRGQRLEDLGLDTTVIDRVRAMNQLHRQEKPPALRRPIPLSVKTRLGYDRVVVESWVSTLIEAKPAAISIHGRTLKQMYRGDADWQAIARGVEVARGSGTLVVGNGDVRSMEQLICRVRETGVDGVLLGRAALGNPWIFRDKQRVKEELRLPTQSVPTPRDPRDDPAITQQERRCVMLEHSRHFERLWGTRRFPAMRKHLAWYCKGFRGAVRWRTQMVRANSVQDVEGILMQAPPDASVGSPQPL